MTNKKKGKTVAELVIKHEFELDVPYTFKQVKTLVKQLDVEHKKEILQTLIIGYAIKHPVNAKEFLTEILKEIGE